MKNIYAMLLLISAMIISCTYKVIETPDLCEQNILLDVVGVNDSACGEDNGEITVEVLNSEELKGELSFQLNGGTPQSSPKFIDVPAGNHIISVSDGLCDGSIDVSVENEDGLSAVFAVTESSCGKSEGAIDISFSNARGDVLFALDGGTPQSSSSFSGLPGGEYIVSVSDESGCNLDLAVTVKNESNYTEIETIVAESCAVSGCHAGNVAPDFRVKENIVERSGRILSRTSAGTMPPASSGQELSDEQKNEIACWVESGAQG